MVVKTMTVLDLFIVTLCLMSALRILTFNRKKGTFKRQYAILAWGITQLFFILAVSVISQEIKATQLPSITLPILLIFSLAIFKANGNVAKIIRQTKGIFQ